MFILATEDREEKKIITTALNICDYTDFYLDFGGFSGAVTCQGESSSPPLTADLLWEESDLFRGVPLMVALGTGKLVEEDFVFDTFGPVALVSYNIIRTHIMIIL